MTIKLIALDIDGTLLNPQHQLTPVTAAAVQAALDQGIEVILATGKQYPLFAHLVQQLKLTAPQISAHGAMITDPGTLKAIMQIGVPRELAAQAITLGAEMGISVIVCRDGQTFVSGLNKDTEYMLSYGEPVPVIFPDLREALDPEPTHLMAIAYKDDALFDRAEQTFKAAFSDQLNVSRSSPYFMEILHPAASKGNALKLVSERLGIAPAEIMAVGDSFNDISMFRFAGISVAMGHAPEAVKQAATRITGSNREDGVAQIIQEVIHEKK